MNDDIGIFPRSLQRIDSWRGEFLIGEEWHVPEGYVRKSFLMSRQDAQRYLVNNASGLSAMMTLRSLLSSVSSTIDLSRMSDGDVISALAYELASGSVSVFERAPRTRRQEMEQQREELEEPASAPPLESGSFTFGNSGPVAVTSLPLPAKPVVPVLPQSKPETRVTKVEWKTAEAYCSDEVTASGTTENYDDGDKVKIDIKKVGGGLLTSKSISVKANAFRETWPLTEILPDNVADHFLKEMELEAVAGGQVSPKPLKARFIPEAKRARCQTRWGAFSLSVDHHETLIEAELNYVQGWAGEVIRLLGAVPATTGGLIVGFFQPGYRWMKTVAGVRHFWDGSAWTPLPPGFTLDDRNHFSVGFYKTGNLYISQYGGEWPDPVSPWDISLEVHQSKIRAWANAIEETWTNQFDMRNANCKSSAYPCCRYRLKVKAQFNGKPIYTSGNLIIVKDNTRSNNALWSLAEPRRSMPAHEFGHHLDNVDEYRGAKSVDTTMNGDGAVNGIDDDSIMGRRMTKVKERHLAAIRRHMASVVRAESGKSYTYKAVRP